MKSALDVCHPQVDIFPSLKCLKMFFKQCLKNIKKVDKNGKFRPLYQVHNFMQKK